MIRKIIKINSEKCNGCGLCAEACHENAINMIDGKAVLVRDDYCDGLGDCLPACPTDAISFEEREAKAYDEAAVKKHQEELAAQENTTSELHQWPVQIKLVNPQAPFFHNASLLIAADCTAFAYKNFHKEFLKDRVVVVGCPKLDACDYAEKLTQIIAQNDIRSVTILRMEVPCCAGIDYAARQALENSKKRIPSQTLIISTDGNIL